MRILLVSVVHIISSLIYSQIPNGYYNGMDTLEGNPLKVALHDIINEHTEFPYTSTSTDVWDILKQTDKEKSGLGLGLFIGKTLLEKNFAKLIFRNSESTGGAEVTIRWKNKDLFNL